MPSKKDKTKKNKKSKTLKDVVEDVIENGASSNDNTDIDSEIELDELEDIIEEEQVEQVEQEQVEQVEQEQVEQKYTIPDDIREETLVIHNRGLNIIECMKEHGFNYNTSSHLEWWDILMKEYVIRILTCHKLLLKLDYSIEDYLVRAYINNLPKFVKDMITSNTNMLENGCYNPKYYYKFIIEIHHVINTLISCSTLKYKKNL